MTNDKHDRDAAVDRLLAGAMARRSEKPAGECLDAGTLAAWADDTLGAGERAAAEAHTADCARCQAMLAAMARTTPVTPGHAASAWRLSSLRWLVPLTAAAAAAIVWMIVPLRDTGPVNVRQVSQSAESIPPPAPTEPSSSRQAAGAGAPSADSLASGAARRNLQARADAKDIDMSRAEGAKAEADQKAAVATNAASDEPARRADARLEKAQAAAAPAASPQAAPVLAPSSRAFAFGAPETIIVSSNPASRWQILQGGPVQRSADGGATWQMQNTGVDQTLSAGHSPSPSVCWLVGPGGIVVVSTDGRSWTRVAFPEAVPLVAVKATDGDTATVTTADGREFVTEDGGRTWARKPE